VSAQIAAVDRTVAQHYLWGRGCDGWHLLADPQLSVIQERVGPGAGEIRHAHRHARQFFYVLSGTARLEFDGYSVTFGARQGVHVPPGTPHRFCNAGDEDVVILVVSSPSTVGDRVNLE
jgi:mannose-6-phosphate isomerase-like protein (cupin superfamily)